jgi:hypothetical protein
MALSLSSVPAGERATPLSVIPAKAGSSYGRPKLDPGLRRGDGVRGHKGTHN